MDKPTSKEKLFSKIAWVLLFCFMVAALYVLFGGPPDLERPHQSDAMMLENFQAHKTEFQQLLQMIQVDTGLRMVDFKRTDPENPQSIGITSDRIEAYRRLFGRLDIPGGFSRYIDAPDDINFDSSSQGFLPTRSKGYAYRKKPPKYLSDSLDDAFWYSEFRHIEGNWYLFYDR